MVRKLSRNQGYTYRQTQVELGKSVGVGKPQRRWTEAHGKGLSEDFKIEKWEAKDSKGVYPRVECERLLQKKKIFTNICRYTNHLFPH